MWEKSWKVEGNLGQKVPGSNGTAKLWQNYPRENDGFVRIAADDEVRRKQFGQAAAPFRIKSASISS